MRNSRNKEVDITLLSREEVEMLIRNLAEEEPDEERQAESQNLGCFVVLVALAAAQFFVFGWRVKGLDNEAC